MKIVISNVYSFNNRGDAAILSVLIKDIKRVFNNPDITILTLDEIGDEKTFEEIPVEYSFMYFARNSKSNFFSRVVYSFYLIFYTLTWAILYRIFKIDLKINSQVYNTISVYKDADLIIPVGGGYIRGQSGIGGTAILFFIAYVFFFNFIMGKIIIGYSQSIGPFGNKTQEILSRFSVKMMDTIIVRERISFELLKKWGITKNVFLSVDNGFLFESEHNSNLRYDLNINKERMVVGITVRNWLEVKKQEKYERDIALLCDYLIEKYNAFIIFIPQVTVTNYNDDDGNSIKRVFSYMKNIISVSIFDDGVDYRVIKSIYGELDYLVGTRFHSVIFALTSSVPSIAIQYEYKTRGIMRDLDLEEWVIDIDKTNLVLLSSLFDNMVKNRDLYLKKLNTNLIPYIEKAKGTIDIVKDVYQKIEK